MNTVVFFGIALGVAVVGYFLWANVRNTLVRLFGVLMMGPSISILMHLMSTYFIGWAGSGPGSGGGLKEWLSYGFALGAMPLVVVVMLMIGLALLGFFNFFGSGGSEYTATPNILGGYSIRKNDLSELGSSCSLLPLALIVLTVVPYGVIYGGVQWLLYRVNFEDSVLSSLMPIGIMTLLVWVVGVLLTMFYKRTVENDSSTVESA